MVKKWLFRLFLFSMGLFVSIVIGLYVCIHWFVRLDIEQVGPLIATPSQTFQLLTQLSPTTVTTLREIMRIDAPNNANSVVALTQMANTGSLLAIYEDGVFRRWDFETQRVISQFNFISASQNSVSFSADGSLVVTPGKILPTGSNGFSVWNTRTGERIECWGPHCPGGDPYDARFIDIGLLLDPKRRWIIEYSETGGSAIGLENNPWGGIDIPESKTGARIKLLTLDKSGGILAYALDNDTVHLFETESFLGVKKSGILKNRVLRYSPTSLPTQIRAFSFDDTRTWLALLNDNELVVWDLRKYINPRHLQISVKDGNVVAFDHTGSILAIGTKKGIMILDFENKVQLAELDVQNVTALYFTLDNRLLVCGDADGSIHLWGVK